MNFETIWMAIQAQPKVLWVALSYQPIVVLFVWALWKADSGNSSTFKFVHFVTNDTGRGSYYALGYTSLVVTCDWGVFALIVMDKLTEWYMTLIIGGFVIGALGGTAARVVAKVKGTVDLPPDAGDDPGKEQPAMDRTTTTTVQQREVVPQVETAVKPPKPKGKP